MFLDKEYSSEVFQTLLAVPYFSKGAVAEVFCKKRVLESFANHSCVPVNFAKLSRTPFFIEHFCFRKAKSRSSRPEEESFFYSLRPATLLK